MAKNQQTIWVCVRCAAEVRPVEGARPARHEGHVDRRKDKTCGTWAMRQAPAEEILVTLTNPATGATVERDVTNLSSQHLDAYVALMDDDIREELHAAMAPCSPGTFLAAWAQRVGPEEAGRVILGS